MANDLNNVILVGRITAEIELAYTPSGAAYSNFSLAVNRKYNDKEEVSFINCTSWNKTAEIMSQYCKKGSQVAVSGELIQDRWEKDGQKQSKIKVVVRNVQFLSTKDGGKDD